MTIELNSVNWSLYNGALVPDAPPHMDIKLSREQAKYLFKKTNAYFIRWSSNYDCGFETEWWYLIRDKGFNLDEFDTKRKKEINKGLMNCLIQKVDAEYIAKNGYEVYISAFNSYDTFQKPTGQEEFYNNMMSRRGNPVFDFWAAHDRTDGKIIGYFMNRLGSEYCLYSAAKFKPDFLKLGVHQALIYEMTDYYLNKLGLRYVCTGARTISHKTHVQEFLIKKLNFRRAFCRLNVIYRPIIKIIVNVLYPFRNVISRLDTDTTNKITVLLRHESIRRSFG